MSATPNNAGAGLSDPRPKTTSPGSPPSGEGSQNALQALLAFACIHEQAERRRLRDSAAITHPSSADSAEEQFALDEVLQLVSERALSITGADGVAIALAEKDAIVCRASFGRIAPDTGIKLDPNSGFSGTCLRSGQTVRCDDSETDSRVNAQICRTLGTRSMVAVPLAAKQRVIGLVEAFSTEPYGFNDSDVRSLNLLGELILAAIRPEEENRLAEIAARVVAPEPAPAKPLETKPAATPVVTRQFPRIIVDEKFAPLPSGEEVDKVEVPPPTSTESPKPAVSPELAPATISNVATAVAPKQDEEQSKEETKSKAITERTFVRVRVAAIVEHVRNLPSFSRMGIAALVVVAIGLGVAVWLKIRHDEQAISANTQKSVEVKTAEGDMREIILPAPAEVKAGPPPQVTGLHHFSSGDTSSVVIDLQDQVQYEEHSLDNPARVYVDIHDTKIAGGLANQVLEVDDSLLKRVRMAQPVEGITRVVLEMKDHAVFSGVKLESNPYRLTIDVHNGAIVAASKTTPSIAPKPSPSIVSTKPASKQPIAGAQEFEVVLDAGHGGWDLGTVGKKGLLEKDIVLDIVGRLGNLIEDKLGARVIYTRQDDSYVSLEKRAEIANLAGATLFLSVHANYSDLSTARGVETYYTNTYSSVKARSADDDPALKNVNWTNVDILSKVTDSHRLAADVQQALCTRLVAINPDLRNRGVKEAKYVVLTGTQMPAVLAEVSFVSSPEEEDHLQSSEYRELIAEALFKGVEKYREDSKSKSTKLASAKKPDGKKD